MSGPPYPRYAPGTGPGETGIGQFQIGISPIGTIPSFDVWQTAIMQYANSPTLTDLIEAFNAALDQTQNMENLYDLIWNVMTAKGYGLDVWGRIVGVIRTLELPAGSSNFGFNEAGASWTGFNQGTFFSGDQLVSNFALSDDSFRTLILAKAAGNISNGGIPSVNAILLRLFPNRGRAYVVDGLNMSLTYKFEFGLTPVETAIIQQAGVLPSAAGVIVNVAQI